MLELALNYLAALSILEIFIVIVGLEKGSKSFGSKSKSSHKYFVASTSQVLTILLQVQVKSQVIRACSKSSLKLVRKIVTRVATRVQVA